MTGDRRGVSEVLSFALVFAIITSSVALAFVLGFPALEGQRDAEQVTNAERAFDILADNMNDVYKRGAPSRVTEIKLSDSELAVVGQQRVNTTVVNGSGDTVGFAPTSYRPIVYQSDTTTLSYANGAVIREDRSAAVMKREPRLLFDEERTVLPTVQTRSRGVQSIGGESTALVRSVRSVSEVQFALRDDPPYEVTYNVTAATEARATAWERYLEAEIDWKDDVCTIHGTKVSCVFETQQLYLSVTRIDVDLE